MSVTEKLGKDILIYAFGNLAQRAVIFLLLPLYTNALDVSSYGLLETVTVTSQILIFVMDIGMSRSILRYYARYQDDPENLGRLISTALIMMIGSGLIFLLLGIIARIPLSEIIYGDSLYASVFLWTLVSSFFQSFNQWVYMIFRARQQSYRYVVVSIVNLIALTTLNIYFVRWLELGVLGVLYAQTIVYLGISLYFLPETILRVSQHFGFSIYFARQLFNFGFPLIFTMSGMLIINSFDRYFLLHSRGLDEVGIYSLAIRIAAILGMFVVTPFQLAWGPFLFGEEKQDITQLSSRFFTYLLTALSIGGVVFLLFSTEIIKILSTTEYLLAHEIVPFSLLSIFLMGIYYWAGGLLHLKEQTWKLSAIVTFAGLSNLVLNALLTQQFGWFGAATADLLARGIAAGLTLYLAIRYYPISFELSRLRSLGIFLFGVTAVYYLFLLSLDGVIAISFKTAVITIGLVILLVPLRFVTKSERNAVYNLLLMWKTRLF